MGRGAPPRSDKQPSPTMKGDKPVHPTPDVGVVGKVGTRFSRFLSPQGPAPGPTGEVDAARQEEKKGPGGAGVGASVEARIGERKLRAGVDADWITRADLTEELGALGGTLKRAMRREIPTIIEGQAKGTCNAAGFVVIDCGAPSASHTWDIKRIAVSAVDPNAAQILCQVRAYRVQASDPFRLADVGLSIPVVDDYGRHQFNLKPEEHFFIVVSGFTANADVFVAYAAEDTTWQRPEEYAE